MKLSTTFLALAFLAAPSGVVFGAEDSHDDHGDDHDDHDTAIDCATVNVTDLESCAAYCGDNYTATFEAEEEHGDTVDGMHVDYLIGYSCECEMEGPTATTRSEGDDDHEEEKHCMIPYELPTCESQGLAMCGEPGDNATSTCTELCVSLGLGAADDSHICKHVHGDDHDHRLRFLAEEDGEHDEHHDGYTMCFCEAEVAGKGTMTCADEGWEAEDAHNSHDDSSSSVVGGKVLAAALSTAAFAAYFL